MGIQNYEPIFNALPNPCLVLQPAEGIFTIVDANNAYLELTGQSKEELVKSSYFDEVLPTLNSDIEPLTDKLRGSLQSVIQNLNPHQPEIIRFQTNEASESDYQYWQITHTPVTNKRGQLVVMLTTSSDEVDIKKSYENYVNCYITKPVDIDSFIEAISTVENFWISIVQLPSQTN